MSAFDLDADVLVCHLQRELAIGTYRPGPYRLRVLYDPKLRLIAAAPIRDRVVHQAVVAELAPTYEPSFYDHSYACMSGRGVHRAVLRYLTFARRHRYRLALDIQSYFATVRHEILLSLFRHRLRDPRTLQLLRHLIEAGGRVYQTAQARAVLGTIEAGRGLAIGSFLSQWSGSFYLDGLDHYIKRVLRIPGYLRYMDDFVLFDEEERNLLAAREAIGEWLERQRSLRLNPKRWEVHSARGSSVFLGYRVSSSGVAPGPKLRNRLRQRLRAAARKGPLALTRTLTSYGGIVCF